MHNLIVRTASIDDVQSILAFGESVSSFSVNEEIRFYEEDEISEFIEDSNWSLGLALLEDKIIGFISVHRMSWHWAMLDNFYVQPKHRGTGVARQMYEWLMNVVQSWGSHYLTCLVDADDELTTQLLIKHSWIPQKNYLWMDMKLKH